ncbi:hypothetical protein M8542_23645 [Amycolatopsis sp. OK19-0408]|uniref:Uncharacterized protein n=1 Tax=Amycolatopsis iheyensis TaxID=2945988 RepID=A0A9X2NFM2_9PSEU|nr:hypothetical protein [Amycolatopsis iheyensis]MCR6485824.1 hypothetical protein [Amycolatopsis iheyensis]
MFEEYPDTTGMSILITGEPGKTRTPGRLCEPVLVMLEANSAVVSFATPRHGARMPYFRISEKGGR